MGILCEQNKFPYFDPLQQVVCISPVLFTLKGLTVHCASSVRRCQRSQHVPILRPLTAPRLVCSLLVTPICTELRS